MPRSLAVIYRPQGSHLAPSLFVHAFTFAGQLPQFCGSLRIRSPQLSHTPRFLQFPWFLRFIPFHDVLFCQSCAKLYRLSFSAPPLLGDSTIRLVSLKYT